MSPSTGVRAVYGVDEPRFRFVVQENYAPYELAVIALAPDAQTLADQKIAYAIDLWRACLASGLRSPAVGLRPVRPRVSTMPAAFPRCFVRRFFLVWAMASGGS